MVSFIALFVAAAACFDVEEMLRQVNRVRAQAGVRPLRINPKLMRSAQDHSEDQAYMRHMSHVGSDGSTISTRARDVGYRFGAIAENVAAGQRSVGQVMQDWIQSPGHYENLVNRRYQDFGAGMANNYWTQDFGVMQ